MIKRTSLAFALAFLPVLAFALTQQDEAFIAAKKVIAHHNYEKLTALKAELNNYPLLPYLDYYQIKSQFNLDNTAPAEAFIKQHPHSPMAVRLKRLWLKKLAEKKDWTEFLAVYSDVNNNELACDYFYALSTKGKLKKDTAGIKPLFLSNQNLPANCNQAFQIWLPLTGVQDKLAWLKFEKALLQKNISLAKEISEAYITGEKQLEAKAVLQVYNHPHLIAKDSFVHAHPQKEVISYGLFRLARINGPLAIKTWHKLKNKYTLSQKQKARFMQALGLKYTVRKNKQSVYWYGQMAGTPMPRVYDDYFYRAALDNKDWKLIIKHVAKLPHKEQIKPRNQYWYGRALDKTNQKEKAQSVYQQLAQKRDYYGFLASRQLKTPIHVKHKIINISEEEIKKIKALPGLKRAEKFYHLGKKHFAAIELYYVMKYGDVKTQTIAITEVASWGWTPKALRMSFKAKHKDDITLRFPIAYGKTVMAHAKKHKVSPALIYAIIRQESLFTPKIKSHAGAIGLMQLMPKTAYKTSRQYKLKYTGTQQLYDAKTNLRFGIAHLNKLHEQLKDHPVLVIAAYNAGKEAVHRWLPKKKQGIEADIWVETIPYRETRKYLKHVIANHVVYQKRLGVKMNLDNVMKKIH